MSNRLSAFDASILAMIAEGPSLSQEELDGLLGRIQPDSQEIARAIVGLSRGEPVENKEVAEAARSLLEWASKNKRVEAV